VGSAIERERVFVADDAEDALIGTEVDLDHDVALGHFLEELLSVGFVESVDAVADAFGVAEFDGLTDVEAQALGRDEAGRKFAGVQSDVNMGIDGVEIVDHLHVQGVIAHGEEAVFRHDEVEANPGVVVRIHRGLHGFKTKESLGEDLFGRVAAEDLIDVADGDLAGGRGLGRAAVLDLLAAGFGIADVGEIGSDVVAETLREKRIAIGSEIEIERILFCEGNGTAKRWRFHQLEVLLILRCRAAGDFVDPFADVTVAEAVKFSEGGEELVVSTEAGGGEIAAHGDGIDEPVVEILLRGSEYAVEVGGGNEGRGAGGRCEAEFFGIDAETVFSGVANKGFSIDGSAEVNMEVGALGELVEEGMESKRTGLGSGIESAGGTGFGGRLREESGNGKTGQGEAGNSGEQGLHK